MKEKKSQPEAINNIADLKPGCHLCAIYETEEEHQTLFTQFMRAGLEKNEKVIYILDARPAETVFRYLQAQGLDTQSYVRKGQLNILTSQQTYLKEGIFDPDTMIAFLKSETEKAIAEGYEALRVTGEMSWSLKGHPGSDRLIEYESRLNDFFSGSNCLAICQYDKQRFDADLLLKVLYTHPYIIVGTEIYDNYYYITPKKMLGPQTAEEILNNYLKNLRDTKKAADELKLSEERYTQSLRHKARDLGNRVKELNCLYGIAKLVEEKGISLNEIIQGTANLIPHSWQYPEITCARIIIDDKVYETDNFNLTEWKQKSDIVIGGKIAGAVEVYYAQKMPESHEGPFLAEERNLIDAIAERLGRIIERIRGMEELDWTKQVLEKISEGISDSIILLSKDYKIIWANKAALEQAGLNREKILGQYCYKVTHGFDHTCDTYGKICPVEQIRKLGKTVNVVHEQIDGKGEKSYVEITAYPIKDDKGEANQFVHLSRDITERRQTEEKLKEANRKLLRLDHIRSDFTSMVSHELRTPLSSIKEGIDIVFEGIDGPINEEQKNTLGIAKKNVDRLTRLINDVLDLSKLESGRMEMVFEKCNIKDLITEVCDLMHSRAAKGSIALSVDMPDEEVEAACDPDRMKQVITNLVDNAIKFTEPGGRIEVQLSHPPKNIQIEVEDTGIGIKEEHAERIFERFSQISRKQAGGKSGSGLGLAICKRITGLHHGKISMKSRDDKGSIFTITFPDDLS